MKMEGGRGGKLYLKWVLYNMILLSSQLEMNQWVLIPSVFWVPMLIWVYTVRVKLGEKRLLEALEGKRKKQATFLQEVSQWRQVERAFHGRSLEVTGKRRKPEGTYGTNWQGEEILRLIKSKRAKCSVVSRFGSWDRKTWQDLGLSYPQCASDSFLLLKNVLWGHKMLGLGYWVQGI